MRLSSVFNGARRLSVITRLTVAGTAVTLGAGAASAAVMLGGTSSPGGTPGLAASGTTALDTSASHSAAARTAQTVTLITGDKIRLDPGSQNAMPAGAGRSSNFTLFSFGGDQYVVPDEAVPYLGSVLDPRLFDVSYLARARLGSGPAGIPVTASYQGTRVPAVPGLHVATAHAGIATGSMSPGHSGQLVALLAARWRTRPAGLAGIGTLSLAPPPGAPPLPASPFEASGAATGLPYHRLTLKLIGPDGKPAPAALGLLQNVQDDALASVLISVSGDTASFAVPAGTYSVAFSVLTPHPGTETGYDAALVADPQAEVRSDKTITLDARTAVPYQAQLSGATAPAARLDYFQYARGDLAGSEAIPSELGQFGRSGGGIAPTSMSATPTAAVTKGTLAFNQVAELASSLLGTVSGPTYTMVFPSDGKIPGSLSHQVPAADLTTEHSTYYVPVGQACEPYDLGFTVTQQPWSRAADMRMGYSVPPGARTDYIYDSDPSLDIWRPYGTVATGYNCAPQVSAVPARVQQGGVITEEFGKGPLVPSSTAVRVSDLITAVDTARDYRTVCVACRQGDVADITIATADSAQHYRMVDFNEGPTSALRFYRDGSLTVTSDELAPYGLLLPMLHKTADYRLDWQEEGTGPKSVDTSWTFRSGPADPERQLPGGEHCGPDPAAACSLLPLLFPAYDLPLNTSSQATAGAPLTVGLTVSGQQNAPTPAGVTVSVASSFDDGKTWSAPADAKPAGGSRFTVTIDQPRLPATSGFGSLRVTARDAAGDTVTQTIIQAYGLTS